jgi:hypothetical protein
MLVHPRAPASLHRALHIQGSILYFNLEHFKIAKPTKLKTIFWLEGFPPGTGVPSFSLRLKNQCPCLGPNNIQQQFLEHYFTVLLAQRCMHIKNHLNYYY